MRASDGAVVVQDLRIADTFWGRFRGLMGRGALAPGEGLWLEPCDSVHMGFMRFAIDVCFLRRQSGGERELRAGEPVGVVLKVCSSLRPWLGMAWCRGASAAIEIEAGQAASCNLGEGDELLIEGSSS